MELINVKRVRNALEAAGIKRYTLYCNNSYLIEVDSESTKCIWDDTNEMLFYIRVPNMVQPKDFRTIAVEAFEYSIIERFCAPTDVISALDYTQKLELTLTDDITKWVKTAGSQSGLYPIQSQSTDGVGNKVPAEPNIPTVR